ncbi:hypothetical protein IWZ00DRAFT_116986 [Phyllosticta capitalensis]
MVAELSSDRVVEVRWTRKRCRVGATSSACDVRRRPAGGALTSRPVVQNRSPVPVPLQSHNLTLSACLPQLRVPSSPRRHQNQPPHPSPHHRLYGPPQQGYGQQPPYGGYPQQPMQYQQGPPQQVIVKEKKDRGCLGTCLAVLCCCFVCEEGCECCAECCECAEECC